MGTDTCDRKFKPGDPLCSLCEILLPLFNSAAMDGIAVVTQRTKGASEVRPVELTEGRIIKL